jgi:hypothetical protein
MLKKPPMNLPTRASVLALLVAAPFCGNADDLPECFAEEVEAHVLEQYGIYGPLSTNREYFGFIYRLDGAIASAISRGSICRWTQTCEVSTRAAAALVPKGAKVLGEWHTHPHSPGSQALSAEDVRGANNNLHIRCYRAFYSKSNGEILSWNLNATLVPAAMASSVRLGNYRQQVAQPQRGEVQYVSRLQ